MSCDEREARLAKRGKKRNIFVLTPNAWLESFGITEKKEQERWNQRVVERVRQREQEVRKARKFPPIGAKRLREQQIGHPYTPHRSGKRMYALSHAEDDRISVLRSIMEPPSRKKRPGRRGSAAAPTPS